MTQHEKIIKRPDGKRVSIRVMIYVETFRKEVRYDVEVRYSRPGKRIWINPVDVFSSEYRRADMDERRKINMSAYLQYVTESEIMTAKMELWRNLSPANPNVQ